jgi:hypothetical protein
MDLLMAIKLIVLTHKLDWVLTSEDGRQISFALLTPYT